MGRTLPSFRRTMDALEAEWKRYRDVLHTREQAAFDALWSQARRHAAASANQTPLEPMEAVLISVLLEHEVRLARLEKDLEQG